MGTPNEQELLAELEKLEKSTLNKGGDALQSAPHDGGFATEGSNIQSKAKAIKKAMKALVKGGMSKSEAKKTVQSLYKGDYSSSSSSSDSESMEKAFDGDSDDDSSSDADSGDADSGSGDADSMSSDGDSDSASAGPPMQKGKMSKSLGASQMAGARSSKHEETSIRKALSDETNGALDAVPVLSELTASIDRLAKSASKSNDKELRKSIEQMGQAQQAFNGKVAQALTIIAKSINSMSETVTKIAETPVSNDRRGNLRKSDIVEPQFHANTTNVFDGRGEASPLMNVEYLKIQETLVDMCMKGHVEPMLVTQFENQKGNLSLLPANVVKQLEQRLCPAA